MRSGTRVTKVTKESEEVTGVEYEEVGEQKQEGSGRVEGPVIFATGGFAGDAHGMLAKYRPDLAGYPTTNDAREGTQPLLEAVGAGVVDMSAVQVHPTGFVDPKDPNAPTKILAAEMLRGEGGILLAGEGERFVDELTTRDKVTDAILAGAKKLDAGNDAGRKQWDVWLVLDAATAEATKSHLGFYKFKGLMKEMTVEDLVTEHGLPNASNAIKAYSKMVASKTRDAFNRTHYGSWALKPEEVDGSTRIVAGRVTPVVHFTMGGVNINENGAVLDTEGQQIRGLWAAGEITGGLHGDNRLGGSSLLECVVFGRRAGDDAGRWWREHYANGEEGLKIQEGGAAGREF
ncbi:hypothetical protein KEM55_000316 [Ascosphaera atra]|nr:hypothetical protein KEM55_000316 [Ascosphaera atra]